jgi:epoxyqueuosine reductase
MGSMTMEQEIKERAIQLGFNAVGIADASPIAAADVERLEAWLRAGHAGQMQYMHRNFEKRIHPATLLKGAQSVIVVALNYKPRETIVSAEVPGHMGKVAQYACYEDYHEFMKPLLFKLASFIAGKAGRTHRFKACVDSVPLAERALAVRAGLGFVGTNHVLIHPTLGPQIFLGELITTAALAPDEPSGGTCGACNRCVRACPTGALGADGSFDARQCISYLTIEHRGDIPGELAPKIGNCIFGCDACVLACPHQRTAPVRVNARFEFDANNAILDLAEMLGLTAESFEERFSNSPIGRTGLAGLQRNARICMGNARNGQGK